tara:strand:+ start:4525 stop:4995 length:471 start_codon:yes stop_codon:yes gene_type:complete
MDKRVYLFGGLALVAGLSVSALQGCDLKTLVDVNVPPEARAALKIPADQKVTYAEAGAVFGQWEQYVQRVTADLSEGIAGAEERYALLQSVADTGLNALSDEVSSFPGGALLVGALGGLGGLFLNKPGTKKRENKQKQVAYAHGVQAAKEVLNAQE